MARRGSNPTKAGSALPPFGEIRLIVPVYLPSLDGYFEHGLRVFEKMLDSIADTTDDRVLVTVIDNGCAAEIGRSFEQYLAEGRVDRLVRSRLNRGKVDAVLAEMKASFEPVVVVADADVVFRRGWVDGVRAAFAAFPECGLLSLHPAPDLRWYASSSILASARSRGATLLRAPVADSEDLERFAQGVGRSVTEQPAEGQVLVARGDHALMLGFAHFAFAVRRAAIADLPGGPSLSTENGVDADYFELPADRAGWWCATVLWALVHHVGNRIDPEEDQRIDAFTLGTVDDRVGALPPAHRAMLARRLPDLARRVVTKVHRSAYGREQAARRLVPSRDVRRVASSASRITRG